MKIRLVLLFETMAGELAQRLAHQPGLQAHLRVAHLAFELGAGDERRHRVDDQHVDGAGADEHLGDLERLLAGVRLRDEQVVDVDAQLARVDRVERVLGVHERGHAAAAAAPRRSRAATSVVLPEDSGP